MKVFVRLLSFLKPYKLTFCFSLGLVGLASALELLKPWPLKIAVDQIIGHQPLVLFGYSIAFETVSTFAQIMSVVCSLVLIYVMTGFIHLLNNYLTIRIGQDMVQDFRIRLFDHMQRQSMRFHQLRPTGDLIYRLMGDTYAVQGLLMNGIFSAVTNTALLIGMFVVLLGMDVELTLYSVAVVPLLFYVISKVSKRIGDLSMESCNMESMVYSRAERIFSSISLIQAFSREEDEKKRFAAESQSSFDRKLSLYAVQTIYGWLVNGLTAVGTAIVLYVGVRHVLDGSLTTGQLLVFIAYLASLYAPLNTLSTTIGSFRASLAQAERVMEILEIDEAIHEAPDARPLEITHGEVAYENVHFGYAEDRDALIDVSFKAPGGALIAVAGPTGAGKTSLMSLLPRFFDPSGGRITIDGQDLRDVTLQSVRQAISVVPQETQLFPMTVRENIAYGRKDASFDEVVRAARLANAHDFIMTLTDGYETVLGERGATLSGGQRQRISIARALLKDAPLLIMDEPTSALDAETEALIMEGLERLFKGRTTFVIAHRLSMMKRADLVLFIKDGRLLESGTFEQLLALNGEFARLYNIQNNPRKGLRAVV